MNSIGPEVLGVGVVSMGAGASSIGTELLGVDIASVGEGARSCGPEYGAVIDIGNARS